MDNETSDYPDLEEGLLEALDEVRDSLISGTPLKHIGSFERRVIDVPEVRARYGMTQQEFADALRISVGTLRGWEQGRRQLDGAARRLLEILEDYPVIGATLLCDEERSAQLENAEARRLEFLNAKSSVLKQASSLKGQTVRRSKSGGVFQTTSKRSRKLLPKKPSGKRSA